MYRYETRHLRQEGWLSPTERASVSAISLMHNLATSRESSRYVVAFSRFAGGGSWLPQESLRHILASPGYASVSCDNRGKCYMDGKRIQCWSKHCSIYPSIFNHSRAIARYWSEIATFSYTVALNATRWGVPIGIPGKSLVLIKLE